MAESERIEILHFDQERYLKEGSELRTRGEAMVRFADQVADEGYDAVFLLGMGGTWDELMQLEYIMNLYADKDLELHLLTPRNGTSWAAVTSRSGRWCSRPLSRGPRWRYSRPSGRCVGRESGSMP